MENPTGTLPETQINGPDPPNSTESSDHDLRTELESLRQSHQSLLSKSAAMEEDFSHLQNQREEALTRNADLIKVIGEISGERDSLREEFHKLEALWREKEDRFHLKIDEELKAKETLENEVQVCKEKIERLEIERKERDGFLVNCLDSLRSIKENLVGIIEGVSDEKGENGVDEIEGTSVESELESELEQESRAVWEEIMAVTRLVDSAEVKVNEYKELRHKERRELGNSVVSLTEENRDISTLLRIALVEKEAVEKRLKGNSEHKRVAILQRVGFGPFGFLMGSGGNEQTLDGMGSSKSDSSECEEEVVSLVSSASVAFKFNILLKLQEWKMLFTWIKAYCLMPYISSYQSHESFLILYCNRKVRGLVSIDNSSSAQT